MRKLLIITLLVLVLGLTSCCCNKHKCKADKQDNNLNYTGAFHNENYVWGGAMNLAWNELRESFIGEPIAFETTDKEVLDITAKLNNPVFTKADLDDKSYYIKSGYGQETVDAINKECRAKFPGKSIPDLLIKLGARDIISYAYFLKEVMYPVAFKPGTVKFMDKEVEGFVADTNSYQNVHLVDYKDDDHFIVALNLKDNQDQLFLAKGYPMNNPEELVISLRQRMLAASEIKDVPGQVINKKDIFQAPKLHLDFNREYTQMLGQKVKNSKLRGYVISVMQEVLKFDMDEKGARVENEAVIGMITSAGPNAYTPKMLILDKPYWVLMKRTASSNPYFLLGVKDTSVMKPLR
jgi:hypothetical protein